MAPMPDEQVRRTLTEAGQGHLWDHALTLPPGAREAFLASAQAFPWARLRQAVLEGPPAPPSELRPPQALTLKRQEAVGGLRPRLAALGRRRLAAGEVATLLLAGGQGSRLGHPGPKGTLVLGPEADRTLYAVLAERVAAAGRAVGRRIPLLVLVGPDTEEATREAFHRGAAAWGLEAGQVTFLRQGTLPALNPEGRALLEAPGRLALAPDGHGGALAALSDAGLLERLWREGVRVLTTFQVDNPLARPLDPVLLGWMQERGAQVVGKAVRKVDAAERVGVFAREVTGRTRIVEYSELGAVGGAEALLLGSIAVHALDLAWLRSLCVAGEWPLPLHPTFKRLPGLSPEGGAPQVKLERFLFDVFPFAPRVEVHEVARAREFAPIKNAEGSDSPASARALVEAEVRRWHRRRGIPLTEPPSLRPLEVDDDGADDGRPAAPNG